MLANRLTTKMLCPRCGDRCDIEIEVTLDGYGPENDYKVGDTVDWRSTLSDEYTGRPPLGDGTVEGYAVCGGCGKDFWVDVVIESDRIMSVRLKPGRSGYLK